MRDFHRLRQGHDFFKFTFPEQEQWFCKVYLKTAGTQRQNYTPHKRLGKKVNFLIADTTPRWLRYRGHIDKNQQFHSIVLQLVRIVVSDRSPVSGTSDVFNVKNS